MREDIFITKVLIIKDLLLGNSCFCCTFWCKLKASPTTGHIIGTHCLGREGPPKLLAYSRWHLGTRWDHHDQVVKGPELLSYCLPEICVSKTAMLDSNV